MTQFVWDGKQSRQLSWDQCVTIIKDRQRPTAQVLSAAGAAYIRMREVVRLMRAQIEQHPELQRDFDLLFSKLRDETEGKGK